MHLYIIQLYRDTSEPEYPLNRKAPNRNREIVACHHNNETLESIAAKFHISLQRVHQIIQDTVYGSHGNKQA